MEFLSPMTIEGPEESRLKYIYIQVYMKVDRGGLFEISYQFFAATIEIALGDKLKWTCKAVLHSLLWPNPL